MGADIHAFIEYRLRGEDSKYGWESYQKGELSLGRHYDLFAALAGVRKRQNGFEELIPIRGFPDDAAADTFLALHYPIIEDSDAPLYNPFNDSPHILRSCVKPNFTIVRRDDSEYVLDDSDHHHSYLTLNEIFACLEHAELPLAKTDIWFQAAIAAMQKLEDDFETRLVFWFDS